MNTPLAILNFKATSRVVEAIRYFSDPKKVTAFYGDLDAGYPKGTAKQLAELLLSYHHDPRAKRVCRTALISVKTPNNASKDELADIDRRLLQAARDFQKVMGIASMLGWVHGNTATRHIHLLFANSNGRRTLDLRPKFLKELQAMQWTMQFLSGRGKGRRKALPMYPKAKRLDTRLLAAALLDSKGKLRRDRWDRLVRSGKVTDFRRRNNGSVISFQFQDRRIRLTTLINFLGLLAGQSGGSGGEANQSETMTTLIDPNAALPGELQEAFNNSGFTSKDVQEILRDIREAQGQVQKINMASPKNKPQLQNDIS